MSLSAYDRAHVGDIIAGEGTWFTACLLRLIVKADSQNRKRLRIVFPEEVNLIEQWMNGHYIHEDELT